MKELDYYQKCGASIRKECSDYCCEVLDKIDDLYDMNDLPLPFICVEGSSGMGKSQLAFTLQGSRPWFYWHATRVTDASQAMYRNFKLISEAFRKVVEMDNPVAKPMEDILNFQSGIYQTVDLWTCGFISCLLKYSKHQSAQMIHLEQKIEFHVEMRTAQDIYNEVKKMKEENGKQLPFFILDEMTLNARTSVGGKSVAAF
ncbi:hypothetical protein GN244_ATG04086 [Phytophthora infestans]|uniref:Crinkler (CRN) family protein n=1 Tax=Phytophthora infestans TaxID=4787 RepID=A0A833THR4_PHYIN|nr:hypothetical protein GN244_ATG04086 [Phytophthora infestans]